MRDVGHAARSSSSSIAVRKRRPPSDSSRYIVSSARIRWAPTDFVFCSFWHLLQLLASFGVFDFCSAALDGRLYGAGSVSGLRLALMTEERCK